MFVSRWSVFLVLLLLLATPCVAEPIFLWTDWFEDSHPMSSTDWTDTLSFPRFNPALGALTTVEVQLSGAVQGLAAYENLSNPREVTLNLQSTLTLQHLDGTFIVQTIPLDFVTLNAGAFDFTIDYGGTSGGMINDMYGEDSDSVTLTSAYHLAQFTGSSPISLRLAGVASSNAGGSGNLASLFLTDAGGTARIRYGFEQFDIPEPGTTFLLGMGLLALGWICKKKTARI